MARRVCAPACHVALPYKCTHIFCVLELIPSPPSDHPTRSSNEVGILQVYPNSGFQEQLKLWGAMGCRIDPDSGAWRRYQLMALGRQWDENGTIDQADLAGLTDGDSSKVGPRLCPADSEGALPTVSTNPLWATRRDWYRSLLFKL